MDFEIIDNIQEKEKIKVPSLSKRLQSSIIDFMFVFGLLIIGMELMKNVIEVTRTVQVAYFASIFFLYEPLFVSFGATLGQYMTKIRVRNFKTGKRIAFPVAVFRFIFKVGLGLVSFLSVHMNDDMRAIHDMVGGSVVVDISTEGQVV